MTSKVPFQPKAFYDSMMLYHYACQMNLECYYTPGITILLIQISGYIADSPCDLILQKS